MKFAGFKFDDVELYKIAYKVSKECNSIYCGEIFLYVYNHCINMAEKLKDINEAYNVFNVNQQMWCTLNYTTISKNIGCTTSNVSVAMKKLLEREYIISMDNSDLGLKLFTIGDKVLELL